MRNILMSIILFFLTFLTMAQDHKMDTTLKSINGTIHISVNRIDSNLALLTSTYSSKIALHDTIYNSFASIDFPDFDNDSYNDILLTYLGNNPTYFLYLFDPNTQKFKSIEGYMKFPDAIQLKVNSNFYYSYHRAGCVDMNWVSDLFKIENFKIVHLGHIYGQGCPSNVKQFPRVINIYKVTLNEKVKEKLISKLPYLKYIGRLSDKWSFIEKYWNKNYQKFN